MNLRLAFAIMVGLGLAMVVFLLVTLALMAVRGAEFLTPTALSVLGLGCVLVVARPAWAIAKRLAPATPSDTE